MLRGTQSRYPAVLVLVAGLLALLPAGTASAKPAAIEEYVLELPGVGNDNVGQPDPLETLAQRAGPVGLSGERDEPATPLATIADLVASPAGALLVVGLAASIALVIRRNRRPSKTG